MRKGDVVGCHESSLKVTLKAIKEIENVNAIKNGSKLEFGHEGLTVIYGENGAGKSGYARVLKKACNARDSKEKILPDIYSKRIIGDAKAIFKISKNNEPDIPIPWVDNQDKLNKSELLTSISFFDTKCASIIVDDNNNVSYLPFGTHVFGELVCLFRKMKNQLDIERPKAEKPEYKSIKIDTKTGGFVERISYRTKMEDVEKMARWDKNDQIALNHLISEITDAEVKDPIKQARKIRADKLRIQEIQQNIKKIENTFKIENINKINACIDKYNATQKALLLVSEDKLSEEPLKGAGSNEWMEMYTAAKAYSLKYAYPEVKYPSLDDDSRCVLCMQPLSQDAKNRMLKFKNFMENEIKEKAVIAGENLKKARDYIDSLDIISVISYRDIIDEINDKDEQLKENIEQYINYATNKQREYLTSIDEKKQIGKFNWKIDLNESIGDIIDSLEVEAMEKEKSAKPEELKRLKEKRDEMQARKTFSENKSSYIQYVKDEQTSKKYDECALEIKTGKISNTGRRIVTEALTPALNHSLKKELENLNISKLTLDLKASAVAGETKHQMKLVGCSDNKAKLSAVLSEGEQKVVALAGFFAELKINKNQCPIIFDDPITSLDHRYRERIAKRIAEEAQIRQVIVFTHDIAFLAQLRDIAGETQTPLFIQSIQNRLYVGERLEVPWHALGVPGRLAHLNTERDKIQSLFITNREEYNIQAGHIYGLLRETWEAFIEQTLLNQIVMRHSEKVQTQRVKAVEIATEDCLEIEKGMSKCSKWMFGHDKSYSIDINRPNPEELAKDIAHLKQINKLKHKKNNETKKKREQRLLPPIPEVG